jgi:hypothetical protein
MKKTDGIQRVTLSGPKTIYRVRRILLARRCRQRSNKESTA